MYKRVLVPLDGLEVAGEAVAHAESIAKALGATLGLLRVIETAEQLATSTSLQPNPEAAETSQDVLASHRHEEESLQARNYLGQPQADLLSSGLEVKTAIREGDPADQILAEAGESDADLMVVTSYGLGGAHTRREDAVFGSVTDSLLRQSRVTVMVVRPH